MCQTAGQSETMSGTSVGTEILEGNLPNIINFISQVNGGARVRQTNYPRTAFPRHKLQ